MFVFSSARVGSERVAVLITDGGIRFRELLGVLPVTLASCRIHNAGDRGQRPGHQHHCSVPMHREPYSYAVHIPKPTPMSFILSYVFSGTSSGLKTKRDLRTDRLLNCVLFGAAVGGNLIYGCTAQRTTVFG